MEDCPIFPINIEEEKEDGNGFIYLKNHPEMINPYLKMKDIKKLVKDITKINEENQRFQILFNFNSYSNNNDYFWSNARLNIYDVSKYNYKMKLKNYDIDVFLDLNKKIEELKEIVFKSAKVPIEYQQFYLNDEELSDNKVLLRENLFLDKLSIKFNLANLLSVKYPNSKIKKISTDFLKTGFELLKQIKLISDSLDIKYGLIYKGNNLNLDEMLVCSGIQNGDLIEIIDRKTFTIIIKTLRGKEINLNVAPYDSIKYVKTFFEAKEGSSPFKFIFGGHQLEDHKTIKDYNIQENSIVHAVRSSF